MACNLSFRNRDTGGFGPWLGWVLLAAVSQGITGVRILNAGQGVTGVRIRRAGRGVTGVHILYVGQELAEDRPGTCAPMSQPSVMSKRLWWGGVSALRMDDPHIQGGSWDEDEGQKLRGPQSERLSVQSVNMFSASCLMPTCTPYSQAVPGVLRLPMITLQAVLLTVLCHS